MRLRRGHWHAPRRCQPGAFIRRLFFVIVNLSRVDDQDLRHLTRAPTGTQAKVCPLSCTPEPIISCPLSGSRSCNTSSTAVGDLTGIPQTTDETEAIPVMLSCDHRGVDLGPNLRQHTNSVRPYLLRLYHNAHILRCIHEGARVR